jgi:diguanylate cyclase (GGDEF)-like protein/PAS domain S-box-containing protein
MSTIRSQPRSHDPQVCADPSLIAARIDDERSDDGATLRTFLWLSLAAFVVLLVLPQSLQGPAYLLYAVVGLTLVVRRCLRLPYDLRNVTVVITLAGGLAVLGELVRRLRDVLGDDVDYPFPSMADLFPLLGYLLFLGAILTIVRRRNSHLGIDPWLDALVGGISAALLQWTIVVIPFLGDGSNTRSARVGIVVFSSLSLLLIFAAVLALVAGSRPSTSNRLLAAGLVTTFFGDVAATLVADGRVSEVVLQVSMMAILVLGGAGLLHPSVAGLFDRAIDQAAQRRLSRRRTVVLAFALVTPPALLLWEVANGRSGVYLLLPAIGALALAPLALVRLARLVHQNEQLAGLEATLRFVGEQLVGAESEDEVAGIVSLGLEQVLGSALIDGRLVLDPDADDALERAGPLAPGVRAIIEEERSSSDGAPLVTGELLRVPAEQPGEWHAAAVVSKGRLRGALVVVSAGGLDDAERNAVGSLCRDAVISLRAVERTESHVRRRSEERFASLVTGSSDIVSILDDLGTLQYVSPAAERLLGWDPAGERLADLVHGDDSGDLAQLLEDARAGSNPASDLRLLDSDGGHEWFGVTAVDLRGDPNIGGIMLTARAIGDRKAAEEQLLLSEARFRALAQHSSDLVMVVDGHDRIRHASPSAVRILGEPAEWLLGRPVEEAFRGSEITWESALRMAPRDIGAEPSLIEFGFRNAKGSWVQMEAMVTDLRGEPAVGGFVINARNVTERQRMLQRLRYQATHDTLTGLPSQVLAAEELGGMLARNAGASTVAVISLDLDDFKDINDSLGHEVGDKLLLAIADRLKEYLSFGDIAARSGGDEFVIVMERAQGEDQVLALAEELSAMLRRPFAVDGRELRITASVGVACDRDRSHGPEALLRDAETAMYRAKQSGLHRIEMFELHMRTASFDRLELRADLQRAIGSDEFVVHYQPVIDLRTHEVIGAEALVRWNHPRRGLVSPGVFVPVAEELGVIHRLGAFVLERACTDLVRWRRDLPEEAAEMSIAVNLSAQELHSNALVETVKAVLEASGLGAESLVLEVTESNLLQDSESILSRMRELRDLGARLAIDDFGTGYSSLGYIQRFDFDILKIDRSFVEGLDHGTNVQIVTAVIEMASQLGVRVVAEGIEEPEQERVLLELGCRLGQGFLYSRPLPESDFRRLLTSMHHSGVS